MAADWLLVMVIQSEISDVLISKSTHESASHSINLTNKIRVNFPEEK